MAAKNLFLCTEKQRVFVLLVRHAVPQPDDEVVKSKTNKTRLLQQQQQDSQSPTTSRSTVSPAIITVLEADAAGWFRALETHFHSIRDAKDALLARRFDGDRIKHEWEFEAILGYVITGMYAHFLLAVECEVLELPLSSDRIKILRRGAWVSFPVLVRACALENDEEARIQAFKSMALDGIHYFSETSDLTGSYPFSPFHANQLDCSDNDYCWNRALRSAFVQFGLGKHIPILVQGIVRIFEEQSGEELSCDVLLLSRCNSLAHGPSYTSSGLNQHGVANEVKYEAVIWHSFDSASSQTVASRPKNHLSHSVEATLRWASFIWFTGTMPTPYTICPLSSEEQEMFPQRPLLSASSSETRKTLKRVCEKCVSGLDSTRPHLCFIDLAAQPENALGTPIPKLSSINEQDEATQPSSPFLIRPTPSRELSEGDNTSVSPVSTPTLNQPLGLENPSRDALFENRLLSRLREASLSSVTPSVHVQKSRSLLPEHGLGDTSMTNLFPLSEFRPLSEEDSFLLANTSANSSSLDPSFSNQNLPSGPGFEVDETQSSESDEECFVGSENGENSKNILPDEETELSDSVVIPPESLQFDLKNDGGDPSQSAPFPREDLLGKVKDILPSASSVNVPLTTSASSNPMDPRSTSKDVQPLSSFRTMSNSRTLLRDRKSTSSSSSIIKMVPIQELEHEQESNSPGRETLNPPHTATPLPLTSLSQLPKSSQPFSTLRSLLSFGKDRNDPPKEAHLHPSSSDLDSLATRHGDDTLTDSSSIFHFITQKMTTLPGSQKTDMADVHNPGSCLDPSTLAIKQPMAVSRRPFATRKRFSYGETLPESALNPTSKSSSLSVNDSEVSNSVSSDRGHFPSVEGFFSWVNTDAQGQKLKAAKTKSTNKTSVSSSSNQILNGVTGTNPGSSKLLTVFDQFEMSHHCSSELQRATKLAHKDLNEKMDVSLLLFDWYQEFANRPEKDSLSLFHKVIFSLDRTLPLSSQGVLTTSPIHSHSISSHQLGPAEKGDLQSFCSSSSGEFSDLLPSREGGVNKVQAATTLSQRAVYYFVSHDGVCAPVNASFPFLSSLLISLLPSPSLEEKEGSSQSIQKELCKFLFLSFQHLSKFYLPRSASILALTPPLKAELENLGVSLTLHLAETFFRVSALEGLAEQSRISHSINSFISFQDASRPTVFDVTSQGVYCITSYPSLFDSRSKSATVDGESVFCSENRLFLADVGPMGWTGDYMLPQAVYLTHYVLSIFPSSADMDQPYLLDVWCGPTLDELHLIVDRVRISRSHKPATYTYPLPLYHSHPKDPSSSLYLYAYQGSALPVARFVRIRLRHRDASLVHRLGFGTMTLYGTLSRPSLPYPLSHSGSVTLFSASVASKSSRSKLLTSLSENDVNYLDYLMGNFAVYDHSDSGFVENDEISLIDKYIQLATSKRLNFSTCLQLELKRVRLGLTSLRRNQLLIDNGLSPSLLDPHSYLFSRAVHPPKSPIGGNDMCSRISNGGICGFPLRDDSFSCEYCRKVFCSKCKAPEEKIIIEYCSNRKYVVCRTCDQVLTAQNEMIVAISHGVRALNWYQASVDEKHHTYSLAESLPSQSCTCLLHSPVSHLSMHAPLATLSDRSLLTHNRAPPHGISPIQPFSTSFHHPSQLPNTPPPLLPQSDALFPPNAFDDFIVTSASLLNPSSSRVGACSIPDPKLVHFHAPFLQLYEDVPADTLSVPAGELFLSSSPTSRSKWSAPSQVASVTFILLFSRNVYLDHVALVFDALGTPSSHVPSVEIAISTRLARSDLKVSWTPREQCDSLPSDSHGSSSQTHPRVLSPHSSILIEAPKHSEPIRVLSLTLRLSKSQIEAGACLRLSRIVPVGSLDTRKASCSLPSQPPPFLARHLNSKIDNNSFRHWVSLQPLPTANLFDSISIKTRSTRDNARTMDLTFSTAVVSGFVIDSGPLGKEKRNLLSVRLLLGTQSEDSESGSNLSSSFGLGPYSDHLYLSPFVHQCEYVIQAQVSLGFFHFPDCPSSSVFTFILDKPYQANIATLEFVVSGENLPSTSIAPIKVQLLAPKPIATS